MSLDSKSGRAPTPGRSTTPDEPSIAPDRDGVAERGRDPMAQPTAHDLLVLASIADVLGEVGEDRELLDVAARWRQQARQAMGQAALRAELDASPAEASALVADLSAQSGSLEHAYRMLGRAPTAMATPAPAPPPAGDGEQDTLIPEADRPVDDPRRWTR